MTSTTWKFRLGGGVKLKCRPCGGRGRYKYFLEPHNFHFESAVSSKTSYYSLLEVLRKGKISFLLRVIFVATYFKTSVDLSEIQGPFDSLLKVYSCIKLHQNTTQYRKV